MNSSLVTPPASLVVTVDELKGHLRVDDADDDTLIAAIITAVTERLQNHIDKKFITQTWNIYLDSFGCYSGMKSPWWDGVREGRVDSLNTSINQIVFPFGPLQAADFSLTTIDQDGAEYVFDSSNYALDLSSPYARVALKIDASWPDTILAPVNGIRIQAKFGYGDDAASVPGAIKQAVLQSAAKFYENRGDNPTGETMGTAGFVIPSAALMLLEPYKTYKVG